MNPLPAEGEDERGEVGLEASNLRVEAEAQGSETQGDLTSRRRKGGKRARNLVLRWALLKALGPDRWHFAALLDSGRADSFRSAMGRALAAKGSGATIADVGAGAGLLSLMAASLWNAKVTRYEKLRPLALLEGKMARANGLPGVGLKSALCVLLRAVFSPFLFSVRILCRLPGADSSDEEADAAPLDVLVLAPATAIPCLLIPGNIAVAFSPDFSTITPCKCCERSWPTLKIGETFDI